MKKIAIFLILAITVVSCSSVKKTQEAINYGNYDEAIEIAIKNLRTHKTKKSNQSYVLMLEEAFAKASIRDKEKIAFEKKDGNPANLESIYNGYILLNNRQELIKPLLPLPIINKGKNAKFQFENYTNDLITTKDKLSDYLYTNAKKSLTNS